MRNVGLICLAVGLFVLATLAANAQAAPSKTAQGVSQTAVQNAGPTLLISDQLTRCESSCYEFHAAGNKTLFIARGPKGEVVATQVLDIAPAQWRHVTKVSSSEPTRSKTTAPVPTPSLKSRDVCTDSSSESYVLMDGTVVTVTTTTVSDCNGGLYGVYVDTHSTPPKP